MSAIHLVNIIKSYDGKTKVVEDINVEIQEGEFFVLVGPSGCGKSTMLRMIAGLEDITEGDLFINGNKATSLLPHERNLSMVFQNYALYPHMTVEKNITFGLYKQKLSKSEQKKRCDEAAEMLGLTPYLQRKPKALSGGQRQRVALARAIVTQSPICLMDEPLSNLDAKLRTKMRSELRQLQRLLGITMVYVTHDQTEAMTMADRMMILNHGQIQQVGKPLEIYNQPNNEFVATFIGAPPMNVANMKVIDHTCVLSDHITIPLPHDVDPTASYAKIGVRAEDITLASENDYLFTGEIVNVEILGTETLLTFAIDEKNQWLAKLNGQWDIQIGEKVPLSIESHHIHLFDEHGQTMFQSKKKAVSSYQVKDALPKEKLL
ncbi:ABC transporter ATP-binding protein [Longirhabdus pacifica]|uniref:ABC transporter ATP-binding protein n=1 Tax=Longirhabdus pacifica TaxID=2305227 RepID=UPI001008A116|nr:ABC transporter ATP-binding protein [Longirhabdus pacifica]